jgi:hypothetical protein
MPAPFTVISPSTGLSVWTVDRSGNTYQTGTITSGDGISLTATPLPSLPSGGVLKLYSPDGTTIDTLSSTGVTTPIGFPAAYAPVTNSAPATITGVTSIQTLATGITVPAGGLAAGQIYRMCAWGSLTTTVDTQTFTFALVWGGTGGTSLMTFGAQTPSSSAPVTGGAWMVQFDALALSATSFTAWGWDGLNFFPSGLTQQAPTTVTNATSKQLVMSVTPSANACSITVNGSYCLRLA